ncbi:hypothetical protein M0R72_11050 [Candidatus Pacearchaeota archaeon]|nr:hypothetical protein [Candidatus Pacearchaeota archaeon]
MPDLKLICPVCEEDISIAEREIKLAVRHKAATGGKALISCPLCSRVLVLPEPVPEDDAALDAWIPSVADTMCVAMLNDEAIRIPAGMQNDLGKKAYRPGGGGPALSKREYMARYGIDPERALANMGRGNVTPFNTSTL